MQTMQAMTLPGITRTFLVHLLARGLEDERYVVERFADVEEEERVTKLHIGEAISLWSEALR